MKPEGRYNPATVRKIKRAQAGPNAKAPTDPKEFMDWLNDEGKYAPKLKRRASMKDEGRNS